MKKIQDFLANLYLKAGLKIEVDDEEEIIANFDSQTLQNSYNLLMKLKKNNYKQFLSCLSILIFYGYSCLKADDDYIKRALESEDESLAIYDDEEKINNRSQLIDYIENAKSIEDLASILEKNNELDLIIFLIEQHIASVFECSYEYICYDIMTDIEPMPLFTKFVSPTIIQETFKVAIDYEIQNDPSEILNLIESFYLQSEDFNSSYELHKYIINCFLNKNCIEQLAVYIKDILWSAYVRCKYQEDDENVSEDIENYIHNYENNPNYRREECLNLIQCSSSAIALKLYLDFNNIDYIPTKDLDSKKLVKFSKEMTSETNELVRKLIHPKEKSE